MSAAYMIFPELFNSKMLGLLFTFILIIATVYLIVFIIKETKREAVYKQESAVLNVSCTEEVDTIIGLSSVMGTRKYQQDRVACGEYQILDGLVNIAVLCDGMGGMTDGEKASDYCSATFIDEICRDKPHWNYISEYVRRIIARMDRHVASFTDVNGLKIKTGTTFISCCVKNNELYWASVGDSRIYILENGILRQITRDHNYGMKLDGMVRAGKITKEQAESDPNREALVSYLGTGEAEIIDVSETPLQLSPGSIVLLCSDGITKLMSDQLIRNVLLENFNRSSTYIANIMTDTATSRRVASQDNTTVAVIKIK